MLFLLQLIFFDQLCKTMAILCSSKGGTVSLKNDSYVGRYSFDVRHPILIIYDRNVPEIVGYQMIVYFRACLINATTLPGET